MFGWCVRGAVGSSFRVISRWNLEINLCGGCDLSFLSERLSVIEAGGRAIKEGIDIEQC